MEKPLAELNQLSSQIIKAAIAVHTALGPGLLESVYQRCIEIELREMGLKVESEVPLAVVYRGRNITDEGFRLDLVVEDAVVVEMKSVEEVKPIHKKQLLTYISGWRKNLWDCSSISTSCCLKTASRESSTRSARVFRLIRSDESGEKLPSPPNSALSVLSVR
jgi:GxxExxY protein